MERQEFVKILEGYAPQSYAESWDNPGLLAGRISGQVKRVLIALDPVDYVIRQAVEGAYDFLITHHPLIFKGIRSVTEQTREGRRLLELISHDIAYYAMHTNCDICRMADRAADMLGLSGTVPLSSLENDKKEGIGRIGDLGTATTIRELAHRVKKIFGISYVQAAAVLGDENRQCLDRKVTRIAISPGSGHDFVKEALAGGAEVLITGDIGHHVLLDANADGLAVLDAGHFGTEQFMKGQLKEYLIKDGRADFVVDLAEEIEPCQCL